MVMMMMVVVPIGVEVVHATAGLRPAIVERIQVIVWKNCAQVCADNIR